VWHYLLAMVTFKCRYLLITCQLLVIWLHLYTNSTSQIVTSLVPCIFSSSFILKFAKTKKKNEFLFGFQKWSKKNDYNVLCSVWRIHVRKTKWYKYRFSFSLHQYRKRIKIAAPLVFHFCPQEVSAAFQLLLVRKRW